ncbi:MAG: hypothetical protein NTX23_00035, partial [Candidatus Bipolaricaulota bacterium]|nr:hypothetical protein [Candidatus Bipolaricaulota bacterium]
LAAQCSSFWAAGELALGREGQQVPGCRTFPLVRQLVGTRPGVTLAAELLSLPVTWMRGDFTARGKHARVAMPEWRKK